MTISPMKEEPYLNSIKAIGTINLTKSVSCLTNIILFDNSSLLQKCILTS